ncbi:hypothetical protein [Formosa algae]|uniref:Uncharacterized membrane protein YciS (DUF1049 family) n=1 Tax=Formosa algae TaxID=225843 RepID=A0A9X0YKF3_9FLAO|nr:hypothetical protein [Formosa algae]MBP1838857.1 uncharacterized membrane protein YciS (DUF1049 family) [Formosa algae]MDQ0333634.1 uncharacterized membrane protein YciS (DUF1049 family) [Formosa algae]OEI78999.1 hypothetical protein AST99_16745 [Formosa algae]
MREEISVNKAINRGHLIVNIPVFVSMFGIPALALYLAQNNSIPKWGVVISFIIGFIVAWLVWSFMITKWRIWAFDNVRNVHELKKRAIAEKLIWNDGKIFEKTEIKSPKQKRKLKLLEKKFEEEDVFKEDFSAPKSKTIYYSKSTNLIQMFIMIACSILGIYLILDSGSYIMGSLFIIGGIYYAYKAFKKATITAPQIIINDKGIETIQVNFKNWSEIKNEEVLIKNNGNHASAYLNFDFKEGFESLQIDDFDITPKDMENLLRTYRIRNKKNYS